MLPAVALALAMLTPPCAAVAVDRAVRLAFARHAPSGRASPAQLRRILRDLGTDVSASNSHALARIYGRDALDADELATTLASEPDLDLEQLDALIRSSATASPTRHFWLALDPNENGIRHHRPGWAKFGRAGLLTPVRLVHYGIGALSLGIGAYDFADFLVHGGTVSLTDDTATVHGWIHTAAAVASLPRFRYAWPPRPWSLWMPTARDANMWPSFWTAGWYTLAIRSDLVLPPDQAAIACTDPWFATLTWTTSAWILYGACRVMREREVTQRDAVLVMLTMTVPMLADTLKCSLLALDPSAHDLYGELIQTHPTYSSIYMGAMLAGLFQGNLVCALSSAEHHGAISERDIQTVAAWVASLATLAAAVGIVHIDDGGFAMKMISLTWEAITRLVAP